MGPLNALGSEWTTYFIVGAGGEFEVAVGDGARLVADASALSVDDMT